MILDMALQICSAMTCLENGGFIHRDLVSHIHKWGEPRGIISSSVGRREDV